MYDDDIVYLNSICLSECSSSAKGLRQASVAKTKTYRPTLPENKQTAKRHRGKLIN